MNKFEQEIFDFQKSMQDNIDSNVFDLDETLKIVKSIISSNLKSCSSSGEFFKSWSSDLQKRFPSGGWRTVNGAKVFVNNGKVVAGLDGFNGEIDKFFKEKNKKVDISHIDFKYYKPLSEHLKQSAGKDDFFVPKDGKDKWTKSKTEQYKKNVKKDFERGVFDEAVKQGKLTQKQADDIIESAGIKKEKPEGKNESNKKEDSWIKDQILKQSKQDVSETVKLTKNEIKKISNKVKSDWKNFWNSGGKNLNGKHNIDINSDIVKKYPLGAWVILRESMEFGGSGGYTQTDYLYRNNKRSELMSDIEKKYNINKEYANYITSNDIEKYHKTRVKDAVLSGKKVPNNVLDEYPDLKEIRKKLVEKYPEIK